MNSNVNKWVVLLVATLASFLTPFMVSAIVIALPTIGREFALDTVLLGWVSTAYLLAAAVFLLPFGRLADIHGRKRVFLYGTIVYTVSSFLAALAPTGGWLIAGRVLQGIGSAMIFGTGVAILTSVFPPGERGKVLGFNVAATYLGLSLGPFLGGLLTGWLGWRSIFLVQVPLGLLIAVLVLWKMQGEWAEARGETFDWLGSITYSLALVALMVGFSMLPAWGGAGLILVGVAGLIAFGIWEIRTTSPVLNVALFRHNQVFTFSNLAALINYSATYAVTFLLSLYLQYIKGFPPLTAGLILVAQPAVQAAFSPVAGHLSDRIEPRLVASLGMAVTTVGLFLLIFLGEASPLEFIVFSLVLLGFGFALFSSPNTNAVMGAVERRFYGVASATLGTMRLVGQTLSMGIAMLVFAMLIGSVPITPAHYSAFLQSVSVIFIVMTILCCIGVFASLVRGKVR
jgi:EmrB/QacA subfamily drug resistance transporter